MAQQIKAEQYKKYNIQKRMDALASLLKQINEPKFTIISLNPKHTIVEGKSGKRYYYIYKNGEYIERKSENTIIDFPIQTPPKKKKHKIKTKKGKIISRNVRRVLLPPLLSLGIGVAFLSTLKNHEESKKQEITIDILEESEEYQEAIQEQLEVNNQNIPEQPILEEQTIEEVSEEQMETNLQIQSTEVAVELKSNMSKRLETDNILGADIKTFSERYGIPTALASALITQERPSVGFENVGQLTRKICGEKYIVPIINKNVDDLENNRTEDKIYIVRDEPNKENFESLDSYKKELEKYQNQLKESKELESQGYQIFYFENLLNNPTQNIHVAMAYLAHSVYGCNLNVHQGTRAYNCGISSAKKASDLDLVRGEISIGDPFYNQNVLSYLYPEELDTIVWHLKDKNTSDDKIISIAMEFKNVKDWNYDYVKEENGPRL